MLIRGELDGSLHYLAENNLVDRSTVDVSGVTRYLFPDPAAEGRRFYAKTGLYPINHTVVVRRSLLDSHPWIALNLYSAFVAAKEEIARAGKSYLQWYFESGLLDGGVKRTLAEHDPLAYGCQGRTPRARDRRAIRPRTGPERAPGRARGDLRAQHAGRLIAWKRRLIYLSSVTLRCERSEPRRGDSPSPAPYSFEARVSREHLRWRT